MNAIELLSTLHRLGVEVSVDGDDLVCRAEPGTLTPELRALIATHKVDVLHFLRSTAPFGPAGEGPIAVQSRADRVALSSAQERLWFLDRLRPSGGLYNVAEAFGLVGLVDVGALRVAVGAVVARQEVLRTRLVAEGGRPFGVVEGVVGELVEVVDLSGVAVGVRGVRAEEVRRAVVRRPFDLGRVPLLRVVLIRLGVAEWQLVVVMPHIVSDAWSAEVLWSELGAHYRAAVSAGVAVVPELPVQYRDFAVWQRGLLSGPRFAEGVAYWRERLAGVPVLELPTDRPYPVVRSVSGGLVSVPVPEGVRRGVEGLARGEGVTVFMVVLAAFVVFLHRYTGERDVAVGTVMSQRDRPELDGLIGLFLNTVVLRTDVGGDPSFRELLGRVREVVLGAFAHQDVPFDRLVEELQPVRDLRHAPLCQVMFVHQQVSGSPLRLEGVQVSRLGADNGGAKFDLTVVVTEASEGMTLTAEYARDVLDGSTVERWLGHLVGVLGGVVADRGVRVSGVGLLSVGERAGLVGLGVGGSGVGGSGVGGSGGVADLVAGFGVSVGLFGGRVAVACGGESLTYAELGVVSDRLAGVLRGLGVGPEVCVGLCVEPSVGLVVGMLGVLKAGGAYVGLDPVLPDARLGFMVADAGVGVVVVDEVGGGRSVFEGLWVVSVGGSVLAAGSAPVGGSAGSAPVGGGVVLGGGQLAYVLYTSGSTGVPKGVGVSHGCVVGLFAAVRSWAGVGADDVWALFHSFGFDVSVWEVWGALLAGGRVEVVPFWVRRSPGELFGLLRAAGVTVLSQTPSAFRQLRGFGGDWAELAVRLVVCGGEELVYPELASWWGGVGAGVRVVNMYGITETTVHVTWCEVGALEVSGARGRVLGEPLADVAMYVLDGLMEPVPVGVVGELYVGGRGVARGYVGRAGLTASRFVPDPFGGVPGARLYRSGDAVRVLPGGGFGFEGRLDRQVKVRGYRLELGEVEAALLAAGVREAVVEHQVDAAGGRLVAYVVGEEQPVEGLRAVLAERLPGYMVPAVFVWLSGLPLTASGKVDRAGLPVPVGRPVQRVGYVGPRTVTESVLVGIWESVLGVDRVGVEDSFFSLGGDSIRSLQVQALAGQRSVRFSLEELFRFPTIVELARLADAAAAVDGGGVSRTSPFELAPVGARFGAGVEDAYPLTQLQAGMLYHTTLAPDSNVYHNTDSFPLRLPGPFRPAEFAAAVRHVVARHPALRTSFQLTGAREPIQLVHRHAEVDVQVRDIRDLGPDLQKQALDALVAREMKRPFDLTRPGLWRIFVHLLTDDTIQMTITECHAIMDGWSWHATLVEIWQDYDQLVHRGTVDDRDRPPTQPTFADYVALELQAVAASEFTGFWREHLRGMPAAHLPGLPTSGADQAASDRIPEIRTVTLAVDDPVRIRLSRLSEHAGVSLRTVFLAAHLRALALFTGERDVVTGVQLNGRPEGAGAEDLRGLFLNLLPFRFALAPGSWRDLLDQVFAVEQAAYPYRRYPLAQIRRDQEGRTLFRVAFNFLDFHVLDSLPDGISLGQGTRSEGTEVPLTVHAYPSRLELDYDANLLSPHSVEAFGRCLLDCLDAMAADPGRPHDAAGLLTPDVRRRLVEEFTATARAPYADTLDRWFARLAAETPDALAVVSGEDQISYRDLDRRANQLARHLLGFGVGPGTSVAVYLDRSIDFLVAVVAVLKTGAAYLPLDPELPPGRLAMMVDDSEPTVIVCSIASSARLPSTTPVVALDDQEVRARLDRQPTGPVEESERAAPTPEDAAYVIYTSGSSGRPKGVVVTHRGIGNRIRWMLDEFGIHAGDRVLQKTACGFDASVWELLAPLLSGGVVVLAEPGAHRDPALLVRTMQRHRVTIVQVVPSLLQVLVQVPDFARCHDLRQIFCAGEILTADLVSAVRDRLTVDVCNTYGPTECSIDVTYWRCRDEAQQVRIPIGRPIHNTAVYLLDSELSLVPIGAVGRLYAAGDGLARGYLAPGMTAERFVPCPFGGPGERMYDTGDLARWRPDGVLEFLGRADHQVKIRGVRIEPAEIESVLRRHDAVVQAAITAAPDGSGSARLVAFVVPRRSEAAPTAAELRTFMEDLLPRSMLPSAIVFLDALPTTISGKVDSAALESAARDARPTPVADEQPIGPLELAIAEAWQEVLGVDSVPRSVGFFALGGDSLMSLQVVARLFQRGIRVTPRMIFEHDTIERIALVADGMLSIGAEQGRVSGEVPLTPIQSWFFDRRIVPPGYWNQARALEIPAHWTQPVVGSALAAVVEHHDALRLRFEETPAGWRQWHSAQDVPLLRFVEEHDPDRARAAVLAAAQELQSGLDLSQGPMVRAIYLDGIGDQPQLIIFVHHLVIDEVSWSILIEDLTTACDQLAAGIPVQLPAKTTSYKTWSTRLVDRAQAFAPERDHWEALRIRPSERLPTDLADGDNDERSASELVLTLDLEASRRLLRCAPDLHGGEVVDVLLAALAAAIRGWSGHQSVLVDVEAHGREDIVADVDLSRTVGWFTSLSPVRLDPEPGLSARSVLASVRQQRQGVAAHGIGCGVLRYLAGSMGSADVDRLDEPEIVFNYLGRTAGETDDHGSPRRIAADVGPTRSPDAPRPHLLEVDSWVRDGQLHAAWIYSNRRHRRDVIRRLAETFLDAVVELVARSGGEMPDAAPDEQPDPLVTAAELDQLRALFGPGDDQS